MGSLELVLPCCQVLLPMEQAFAVATVMSVVHTCSLSVFLFFYCDSVRSALGNYIERTIVEKAFRFAVSPILATHSQSSSTCKEHVPGHFLQAYNFADLTWIVTPTVTRQCDAHRPNQRHAVTVRGRLARGSQVGAWRMTLSGGQGWGHQPSSDHIRSRLVQTGLAFVEVNTEEELRGVSRCSRPEKCEASPLTTKTSEARDERKTENHPFSGRPDTNAS